MLDSTPIGAGPASTTASMRPSRSAITWAEAVVDAGPAPIGVESSIVACLGGRPVLLRAGGVTREAIEQVVGAVAAPETVHASKGGEPRPLSPGLLASHYAPRAVLRLGAADIRSGEAALLFGERRPLGIAEASAVLNLSPAGDLAEAAANLFAHLRELDARLAGMAEPRIAVMPIPVTGLGEAINDRLRRAAADR